MQALGWPLLRNIEQCTEVHFESRQQLHSMVPIINSIFFYTLFYVSLLHTISSRFSDRVSKKGFERVFEIVSERVPGRL